MDTLSPHAPNGKARIYGLPDPRTQELRYVGRTTKTLASRLNDHLRDARDLRDTAPRFPWIRELQALRLQPEIFLIEEVPLEQMAEAEGNWITYFRYIGANLLNVSYRMGKEGQPYPPFVWTDEMIARLGTLPDADLGRELGVSRRVVERKRHNLSIEKHGNRRGLMKIPSMGGWNKIDIPQHILDRLGTISDEQLGKELGVSKKVIAHARKERGIPDWSAQHNDPTQFKFGQPHPRWDGADKRLKLTPEIVARMGIISDQQLAEELGYKSNTPIYNARRALGIPSAHPKINRKGGDANENANKSKSDYARSSG